MKRSGLSTTMSGAKSESANPSIRGARTAGYCPPFSEPHSKGPDTIPVVFEQDLPGAKPATISSTMNGPQFTATGKRESELGRSQK